MANVFNVFETSRVFGEGEIIAKGQMGLPNNCTKCEVKNNLGIDSKGKPFSSPMLFMYITNGQFYSFPLEKESGLEFGEITDKKAMFTLICRQDPNDPTKVTRKVKKYVAEDEATYHGVEELMAQIKTGAKHF